MRLLLLVAGCLFVGLGEIAAAVVDVKLYCVLWEKELLQQQLFLKGATYFPVDGVVKTFPQKFLRYRGENPATLYKKNAGGAFESWAAFDVPAGTQEVCLVIGNDAGVPAARAFDCSKNAAKPGQLVLVNLTDVALRGSAGEGTPITLKPGELGSLFSLPKESRREPVSLKVVAAAKSQKDAKRTWRFGNSLVVFGIQSYFLVVGPSEKNDPERPKRYEAALLQRDKQ